MTWAIVVYYNGKTYQPYHLPDDAIYSTFCQQLPQQGLELIAGAPHLFEQEMSRLSSRVQHLTEQLNAGEPVLRELKLLLSPPKPI